MSNETYNVKIGNSTFALSTVQVKRNRREENPAKPGTKKTVQVTESLVFPNVKNRAAVVELFGALFDGAEAAQPGNGLAYVVHLLRDNAELAEELTFKEGDEDINRYGKALAALERPRSAGMSEKDILLLLAGAATEFSRLGIGLREGWEKVVDKATGQPIFDSEDALIQRYSAINTQIESLTAQLNQRQLRSEEARKRREEKAKAAAIAAAAAPAPKA